MSLYGTSRLFLSVPWKWLYRLRVEGAQPVPVRGPVVLASNHPTYLDPITVGVALPRPITYMAWDESLKWPVVGTFLQKLGTIPVPE